MYIIIIIRIYDIALSYYTRHRVIYIYNNIVQVYLLPILYYCYDIKTVVSQSAVSESIKKPRSHGCTK